MFGFIAILIVIVLVLGGAGYWLQAGTRAEIAQRRRARSWPTTTGTVTDSHVEALQRRARWRRRRHRYTVYQPLIGYTYLVNGRSYQSSRYKNRYITQAESGGWWTYSQKKAQQILAEHPQGKQVTVTYNPDDPALAYLAVESSLTRPLIFRVSGLLLMAAAGLLLLLGAYRVIQDLGAQSAARNQPAAVPASTEEITAGLARDLGLTCKPDEQRDYNWDCESPSGDSSVRVYVYSRERATDKVDSILASADRTDQEQALSSLAAVVALVLPPADLQMVQDWMAKTVPSLTAGGDPAEMTANGVKFVLVSPWVDLPHVVHLEIGEMK
jgi:hypothetical protein